MTPKSQALTWAGEGCLVRLRLLEGRLGGVWQGSKTGLVHAERRRQVHDVQKLDCRRQATLSLRSDNLPCPEGAGIANRQGGVPERCEDAARVLMLCPYLDEMQTRKGTM